MLGFLKKSPPAVEPPPVVAAPPCALAASAIEVEEASAPVLRAGKPAPVNMLEEMEEELADLTGFQQSEVASLLDEVFYDDSRKLEALLGAAGDRLPGRAR